MPNVRSIINDSRAKQNSAGSVLVYPKNIAKYGMLFMFEEYNYNATNQTVSFTGTSAPRGSIILPIPTNGFAEKADIQLSDSGGIMGEIFANISGSSQDLTTMTGLGKAYDNITNDLSSAFNNLTNDNKIKSGAAGLVAGAGLGVVGSLLGRLPASFLGGGALAGAAGAAAGAGRGAGIALNNFTALSFNNVGLRSHNFSWRFFPEDSQESDLISQIRTKFQQAAHPTYTLGGQGVPGRLLLSYPMLVKPYILIDQSEIYYYQMKPCLIDDVSFSYRGDGGISLLKGGKPAVVEMNLSLKETAIWTAEDYGATRNAASTTADSR